MACKIAAADIAAEELTWQPVGSAGPAVKAPMRNNTGTPAGAASESDAAAMSRKIAEIEARRAAELEQARQSGFEQGIRQARLESSAEMEGALDRLARAIQEVAKVKKRVRSEAEGELVKLSLAIARRILHREVTADPQALRGVVYSALERLQNREITRIRVFPAAVPAVRTALERNGGLAAIEIVADGLLQPGGIVFETALGELDASVETQLQEIERGFADKLQIR